MSIRTSAEWIEYYSANAAAWDAMPWHTPPGVSREELAPILSSIQAWQLGETSDGRHLRALAARYAAATGDAHFPAAVEHFIREEQTHGEALGWFLDQIGAARVQRNWGDSLFRICRYTLPSIEVWTTVVIMVETLALVFYASLRRATPSPLLRAICAQILRDEIPHLRFQYQRLGSILADRHSALRWLTLAAHRGLYCAVVLAVWIGHAPLFRAGGHTFRSYWSAAWRKMNRHWHQIAATAATLALPLPSRPKPEPPSRLHGWLH